MSEPANSIDPILDPRGVAMQWMFRVRRMQVAHYDAARRYSSYRFWLGCTVIMLGTVVRAYASRVPQNRAATKDFFEKMAVEGRCEPFLGDAQFLWMRLQQRQRQAA